MWKPSRILKPLFFITIVFSASMVIMNCARSCGRKKPSTLEAIPADATAVMWMPAPKEALLQATKIAANFKDEPLFAQLQKAQTMLSTKIGIDLKEPQNLKESGIDFEQPIAMASLPISTDHWEPFEQPLILLAVRDEALFLKWIQTLLTRSLGAAPLQKTEQEAGRTYYSFGEAMGEAMTPTLTLSFEGRVAILAYGDECEARVRRWPRQEGLKSKDGAFSNFAKAWKRAESDGSEAGAALRVYVKEPNLLLRGQKEAATEKAEHRQELRIALYLQAQRIEIKSALLGLSQAQLQKLVPPIKPKQALPTGNLLNERSWLWAKSRLSGDLAFSAALRMIQRFNLLGPNSDSEPTIAQVLSLLTGSGELVISTFPQAVSKEAAAGNPSLTVRDLLQVSGAADIQNTEQADASLVKAEKWMHTQQIPVTLSKNPDGIALTGRDPMGDAKVVLQRKNSQLLFTMSPPEKSPQKAPDNDQIFAPLMNDETSGMIIRFGPLLGAAKALFEQQSRTKMLSQLYMKSLEHLQSAGCVLEFEGPAYEPHPQIRAWIQLQPAP